MARCADCANFHRVDEGGGDCRASPPLVLVGAKSGLDPTRPALARVGYWPPVANDDWCGAFKRGDRYAPSKFSDVCPPK